MNEWTTEEKAYLESLADEYGIDPYTVFMLADLNPNEIYDGLLCDLEDAYEMAIDLI